MQVLLESTCSIYMPFEDAILRSYFDVTIIVRLSLRPLDQIQYNQKAIRNNCHWGLGVCRFNL